MSPFILFTAVLERSLNTFATRSALRTFALGVLSLILLCAVSQGAESVVSAEPAEAGADRIQETDAASAEAGIAATAASHTDIAEAGKEDEERFAHVLAEPGSAADKMAFFQEMGRDAWVAGDRPRAEAAFAAALDVNAPVEDKRELLLEMGELFSKGGEPLKAIVTFEKFCQTLPSDAAIPGVLLQLGVLYRETGALAKAVSRFFLVLNSTLHVAPENFENYRKLAMKARLEIAETYSLQGDHEEARKYYSRLELLDLDESDRERVVFCGAQLQFSLEQWIDAELQLAGFIERYPDSASAPEARYLLAKALEKLDRREEAVEQVLALLQTPDEPGMEEGRGLAYWKRRTGNELANRFYEQGDIMGALSIYQELAKSSDEPAWQWPAVYQIGLCFERLNLPERAVEAYQVIVARGAEAAPEERMPEALSAVQSMAKWRLEHLDWVEGFEKGLQVLSLDPPVQS
ncbi:MAG: tetratricopeptide repeat protein [Opitutaceae bacterium]